MSRVAAQVAVLPWLILFTCMITAVLSLPMWDGDALNGPGGHMRTLTCFQTTLVKRYLDVTF